MPDLAIKRSFDRQWNVLQTVSKGRCCLRYIRVIEKDTQSTFESVSCLTRLVERVRGWLATHFSFFRTKGWRDRTEASFVAKEMKMFFENALADDAQRKKITAEKVEKTFQRIMELFPKKESKKIFSKYSSEVQALLVKGKQVVSIKKPAETKEKDVVLSERIGPLTPYERGLDLVRVGKVDAALEIADSFREKKEYFRAYYLYIAASAKQSTKAFSKLASMYTDGTASEAGKSALRMAQWARRQTGEEACGSGKKTRVLTAWDHLYTLFKKSTEKEVGFCAEPEETFWKQECLKVQECLMTETRPKPNYSGIDREIARERLRWERELLAPEGLTFSYFMSSNQKGLERAQKTPFAPRDFYHAKPEVTQQEIQQEKSLANPDYYRGMVEGISSDYFFQADTLQAEAHGQEGKEQLLSLYRACLFFKRASDLGYSYPEKLQKVQDRLAKAEEIFFQQAVEKSISQKIPELGRIVNLLKALKEQATPDARRELLHQKEDWVFTVGTRLLPGDLVESFITSLISDELAKHYEPLISLLEVAPFGWRRDILFLLTIGHSDASEKVAIILDKCAAFVPTVARLLKKNLMEPIIRSSIAFFAKKFGVSSAGPLLDCLKEKGAGNLQEKLQELSQLIRANKPRLIY